MKILINLVLFNHKNSLSLAKKLIKDLSKEISFDIFLHSNSNIDLGQQAKKTFTYPDKFDFKTVLKQTLITLNDLEINELNRYDAIFTISDVNHQSFIRLFDVSALRIKYFMKNILRSTKTVVFPLRFSEPFNSIDSMNSKIFISSVQIFRLFVSMALRSEANTSTVFGFLAHRLGITVLGVED